MAIFSRHHRLNTCAAPTSSKPQSSNDVTALHSVLLCTELKAIPREFRRTAWCDCVCDCQFHR